MKGTKILAILLLVVLGVVLGGRANAVGATSSIDGEFAYVRIFSAKISDGIDKPLDELEAIARERGSEEVAIFPLSLGPEGQADRWIVRLGSKGYAYPGLTVKARTYLSEQRQKEGQRKISTLSVSNDRTRVVQVLPTMDVCLEWTLPVSVQSPLLYSISRDNKLLAVNTIRERLSPSGEQRWPKVIRIDLPEKNASIIQIFEYLDTRPDGLSSFQEQLSESLPAGTMVAEPFAEPLAKPFGSSGVIPLATSPVEGDNIAFDYSWGFDNEWDTGWQPGGSKGDFFAQIRLEAGASAHINSRVWGDFQLSRESLTNGQLKVGSGHGNLEMDFGAHISARGYLDLVLWDGTFDLPFVPQIDFRSEDTTSFNSYLLDSTAFVSGSTGRQKLFEQRLGARLLSISAALYGRLTLSGEMRAQSISTSDGRRFTSEGQSLSVSLVDGTYDKQANYNEDLTGEAKVTFYPSLCGEFLGYRRCLTLFDLPWTVWSGRIPLDFSSSRLAFGDVPPPASGVLYVDDDATGRNDGSSWANAYNYLYRALGAASVGDEIWVAQGVYKPPERMWLGSPRSATFRLKNVVTIKGGYAGYGEPDPDARDIGAYETVLSGDVGEAGDDTDNCYHVVTGSGCDGSAMLDGFTITGGNANGSSAGGYDSGGGIYNEAGSPTVTNCTFIANSADFGAGMDNGEHSNPAVTNCIFSSNWARIYGGGMMNGHNSPTLTNCTFSANSADYGGGMRNYESSPTLTNCTFSGNSAYSGGGMRNWSSSPTLTNCTFSGNSAGRWGGGMSNARSPIAGGSNPTLTNCILWDNSDTGGLSDESSQIHNVDSSADVSYSCIQGWTGALGGVGNIGANPMFADADGRLSAGSPCIDAGNNSAVPAGVTTDLDGNQRIINGIVDMGAYESSMPSCPPPTGVSATQGPGPGQIVLRWNRSPDATDYKIFYDEDASNPPFDPTQDGSPSSGSDVGNVTQVTISGLTGGETYYFAVKAYNATCESYYSAQDSELVPSEPVVCYYATGDRVILLVDNPREATNLPAGTCGTVLCTDSADPELPVLVSWDMWYGGYSDRDMSCDTQPPRYPNNTAYWMACDQIAPGCTEGYFDECGVVIREVDRGVGYLLFEADTGLRYHVGLYGFQFGDRIRVRGLVSFCIIERYQVNGCIEHAIVSQCVEAQVGCCSPPYSAGDRVRLLVSNPYYAVGLPAGTYGTVLCCDSDDPDRPIFVSWDGWTNGWDKDEYCDIPPGPYPPESGYWVSCDQIEPFTGPRETACCDIPYPAGARVRLRVSSPRGAAGLVADMLGTVICCDYDDPDLPIFVSWDGWSNGRNSDSYCDTSVWSYPADSGWWMACDEIEPFTETR